MRRNQLGDLPYDRDHIGPMNRPSAALQPGEWENRDTASLYPFTVGLAAIQVVPANSRRTYVLVQNKDAASDMLLSFGQKPTTFSSVIIIPRGNYELVGGSFGGAFVPSNSVWVLGTAAAMDGVLVEGVLPLE
jgi:hypothetical protein